MPNMGIKTSGAISPPPAGLADALFTQTQQRVLGLLFGQPQRRFTVSELIASTGAGSGAVQRELAKLLGSGLLTQQRSGNQKHYQANAHAPIHAELVAIMHKTVGLVEPLRAAMAVLADRISAAFVYGSVAKGSDTASSDIDLMILSDTLGYGEVMAVLHALAEQLGRQVNPTIYSHEEFDRRMREGNSFLARVMEQPKWWVIGGKDDLDFAQPHGERETAGSRSI